jgi:hypothetical protein
MTAKRQGRKNREKKDQENIGRILLRDWEEKTEKRS